MTAPELRSLLETRGIQTTTVSKVEDFGADDEFLVFLLNTRRYDTDVEELGKVPELASVERRHNKYIWLVRVA